MQWHQNRLVTLHEGIVMPFHLDGTLFRDTFGTGRMRDAFSEEAFIERFLEVEAALARAEADVGLVPEEAAATITARASLDHLDRDRVHANVEATGIVSMSIIGAWLEELGEAGKYVHLGATSQDIYDTAVVLQMREGLRLLKRDHEAIIEKLLCIAAEHRETPMIGRTHYVHAIPITFGLKVAVWAAEFGRHRDRLSDLEDRLYVVQFFGATGTLASLGDDGFQVQRRLAAEIDLEVPTAPWFAARDRFAEVGNVLALIASTAGKLARQVLLMNRPEFGEVTQHVPEGAIGSSTMPHKQNPTKSEKVAGLAQLVRSNAATMLELMETVDERSASTLYMEFAVIPELFCYAARILENTRELLDALEVHPDAMKANIDIVGDLIASERVMMALADHLGRQQAHELIYELAMAATEGAESFTQKLLDDPIVADHLSPSEVRELTDPTGYLGDSARIVDRVLEELEH